MSSDPEVGCRLHSLTAMGHSASCRAEVAVPQAIRTMEEDPLNAQGAVRARTANELLKAFHVVSQREGELWLPIYAHHGSSDRLANLKVLPGLPSACSCCQLAPAPAGLLCMHFSSSS